MHVGRLRHHGSVITHRPPAKESWYQRENGNRSNAVSCSVSAAMEDLGRKLAQKLLVLVEMTLVQGYEDTVQCGCSV